MLKGRSFENVDRTYVENDFVQTKPCMQIGKNVSDKEFDETNAFWENEFRNLWNQTEKEEP